MSVRVLAPGALTTVQDLGRPGWGSMGVAPSGAFDVFALRAANLLVGNDERAAALEMTIAGPTFVFEADHVVALAGAPFRATLEDREAPNARSFTVTAGETLRIGSAVTGARAYVAVRGGLDVPTVLGSRSTHVAASLGGLGGGPLAEGDVIGVGSDVAGPDRPRRITGLSWTASGTVRAVPGPQTGSFTARGITSFFSSEFGVTPRADRVGVRLDGEAVELNGASDLDPEGLVTGAVQIPGDGLPIVLGPDRPATGGYVKIATVISADLPVIAQARPGDRLRFAACSVEEARAAARERERMLYASVEVVS